MAEINPDMVRRLRERTGGGLMECKRALEASKGDEEGAVDFLRKSGLKTAEKKAAREMSEGRIQAWIAPKSRVGALVALTCETDFVARTPDFQQLLSEACTHVAEHNPANVEALLAAPNARTGQTWNDSIKLLVGKIGENISIGKIARCENMQGRVGSYVHHDGKKAALVAITTNAEEDVAAPLLKDVCMHIVFANPAANERSEIPAEKLDRERAIYLEEVKSKPADIQEKIIGGKLDKFYGDQVLSEQKWFKDDTKTVQKVIEEVLGKGAKIQAFARFQIGG